MTRHANSVAFTLTELMISMAIGALVLAGAYSATLTCMKIWHQSEMVLRVSGQNSLFLERLTYGSSGGGGLREAFGVTLTTNANGWAIAYLDANRATNTYTYQRAERRFIHAPPQRVVCSNVTFAVAVTNVLNDSLTVRVDMRVTEGAYSASNSMTTRIAFRNVHGD